MAPERRGKLEGSGRVQVGAEFIILLAGPGGPRTPSPSLRGWSESLWMPGVRGSGAVSWCFENLSASHVKLKCK